LVLRAGFFLKKMRLYFELMIYDKYRGRNTGPQCVKYMKKTICIICGQLLVPVCNSSDNGHVLRALFNNTAKLLRLHNISNIKIKVCTIVSIMMRENRSTLTKPY
jgi:hypothetical protein